MKNFFGIALISLFLLSGCVSEEELDEKIIVRYEMITSDGDRWKGAFNDEFGVRQNTSVLTGGVEDATLPSGWTMEFTPKTLPITLLIGGSTECKPCNLDTSYELSEDLTANIYINDILVSSHTNSYPDRVYIAPIKGFAGTWLTYPETP